MLGDLANGCASECSGVPFDGADGVLAGGALGALLGGFVGLATTFPVWERVPLTTIRGDGR